ncbi:MAG: L7Ae/L30e/S12e/Gadd45 family ribosomal protein [Suipraeoptans sp.]
MTNKALSMIGLATKAGKTVSGEFMTEKVIKTNQAKMIIVAEDASDNTKKMFRNMCEHYKVPMYISFSKEELGRACGKSFRASIAIMDEGFYKSIVKYPKTK